jgi:hypothetical protein
MNQHTDQDFAEVVAHVLRLWKLSTNTHDIGKMLGMPESWVHRIITQARNNGLL